MRFDLLYVEDNPHKRSRVVEFIASIYPEIRVSEAKSFNSGVQELEASKFDIVLLDISLPTFDQGPTEAGGRTRTFGGREIARKLVRKGRSEKIIFITQYTSFSDRGNSYSLDELRFILAEECGQSFIALVSYDSSKAAWKDALDAALTVATR